MGILWEGNVWVFVLVTVVLGGAAAYQTGKAVSLTWRPLLQLVAYILLLGCAVRFIHFSLFGGTLRSPHYYAADLLVLALFAALGFRLTRTRQMIGQYSWLYQRSGPLSWRNRAG